MGRRRMGPVHQVCLAAALLLPAVAQETPVFRADVRLVRLLATVKAPNGNLIGSLTKANFRVFVNPMVNFIWLGGFVVVFGAHLAVLPDRRERKRLQAALALEDRAVA